MDEDDRRLVEQLTVAVEHRTVIGMALGILMERFDLGPDEAFARLRRVSSLQNRKLYNIACEFVDTRALPNPPPTRARRRSGEA
jgi:AmiR/NasT family two-component response regulator